MAADMVNMAGLTSGQYPLLCSCFLLKFAAAYSGSGDPVSCRVTLLLFIVPLAAQVVVWINRFHPLWFIEMRR